MEAVKDPSMANAEPPIESASEGKRRLSVPLWLWPVLALIVLVCGVVGIEYLQWNGEAQAGKIFGFSSFLKLENIVNILNQYSYVGIVAIGMTFIITSANIDLSAGSLLALLSIAGLMIVNWVVVGEAADGSKVVQYETAGVLLGLLAMIVIGCAAGGLNGFLVSKGRIASFIVTLGGFAAYRSIALFLAEGGEVTYGGGGAFKWLGNTGLDIPGTNIARRGDPVPLEFPFAILIWLGVAVLAWVLLNKTRFGRYTIAVGANEKAALYSAVPVKTVKTLVFVLMGGLVGLASFMYASRLNSVSSGGSGMLLELDAIAAVVVGGTRLAGGRGTIAGTVLGVLILGVITNMLTILSIDANLQGLVKGGVIVLAVLIQKKT